MRKLITWKRAVIALVATGLAAGGALTALAFFTGSGSGSGTATVASDAALTVANVSFGGQLYPGNNTPVTFAVSDSSPSVSLSVGSVIADTGTGQWTNGISGLTGACLASDFTFAAVPVTTQIGPTSAVTATGALSMTNATTSQDACKGQTPTLHLITKSP